MPHPDPDERERAAREAGRLAGLHEAFEAETRTQIANLYGSVKQTAAKLDELESAVSLLPSTMRDLIDEALAKQARGHLTRLQLRLSLLGGAVAVGAFVVSIISAWPK